MNKQLCCMVATLLAVVLPGLASAEPVPMTGALCVSPAQALISEGNGALWRASFEQFAASHPELSSTQQTLVTEALNLAPAIAAVKGGQRVPQELIGRVVEVVVRTRAALSPSQRGELFSRMGPMQTWLIKRGALATPFCDCAGTGACGGGGQPSGTCSAGCISWDGNGTRYDGLCGTSLEE
jgi:hypothetical protein